MLADTIHGRRRAALVLAATLAISAGGLAATQAMAPADASTIRELSDQVKDTKAEIEGLHARAEEATERINEANIRLDETNARIEDTQRQLDQSKADLARLFQKEYKSGGTAASSTMEAVLASSTVADMDVNIRYAQSFRQSMTDAVHAVNDNKGRLEAERAEQEQARADIEAGKAEAEAKAAELEAKLATLQADLRNTINYSMNGIAANATDVYDAAMVEIGDDPTRKALIDAAYSLIGTPYGYGCYSPGTAIDCSGFTAWSYSQIGVGIPHSSVAQCGISHQKGIEELLPGDLIFWVGTSSGSGSGSHVAMYLGNGKIIHASWEGVIVQGLYGGWNACGSIL